MWLLLILPALLLATFAWRRYRRHPLSLLITTAILFGIGYWYVLPGGVFLQDSAIQGNDWDLVLSSGETIYSIWLVNFSLGLLLILPEVFRRYFPLPSSAMYRNLFSFSKWRLDVLLLGTLVFAAA